MSLFKKIIRELGYGFLLWAIFWTAFGVLPQKPFSWTLLLTVEILLVILPYLIVIGIRLLVRKLVGPKYASAVNWLLWALAINWLVFGANLQNQIKTLDESSLPFNASNFLLISGIFVIGPYLFSLMNQRSRRFTRAERKQMAIEKFERRAARNRERYRRFFNLFRKSKKL